MKNFFHFVSAILFVVAFFLVVKFDYNPQIILSSVGFFVGIISLLLFGPKIINNFKLDSAVFIAFVVGILIGINIHGMGKEIIGTNYTEYDILFSALGALWGFLNIVIKKYESEP